MSGIFGSFYHGSTSDLSRLEAWNKAYGNSRDCANHPHGIIGIFEDSIGKHSEKKASVICEDGIIAVVDAIIYNREELLGALSVNEEISDEKLIFDVAHKFGPKALKNVNGDFAGAIYYQSQDKVILFRDHMGVRPLFYYFDNGELVFSSDIRGITALDGIEFERSSKSLSDILHGHPCMETVRTDYNNIHCVRPGGYSVFNFQDKPIEKSEVYWQLKNKRIHFADEKEYSKHLRKMIEDSVQRRLDAINGLVGAELSGGLDSSSIGILISRFKRDCIYYSWAYSPDDVPYAKRDERLRINDVCDQEGIECHYRKIGLDFVYGEESISLKKMHDIGIFPQEKDGILYSYAMPPYINSLTITATGSGINSHGGKVVFSGHGGDEGVSHRANPFEMFYRGEIYHYFRYMFSTTHGKKHRIFKTFKAVYDNLSERSKVLSTKVKDNSLPEGMFSQAVIGDYCKKRAYAKAFSIEPAKYIRGGGSRNRLDNTALQGAYCNARYIFPFLDYRVVEYAVSIPRFMFLRGKQKRYVFREAFKDVFPKSIYEFGAKEDTSFKSYNEMQEAKAKEQNYVQDPVREIHEMMEALSKFINWDAWREMINKDIVDIWMQKVYANGDEFDIARNVVDILSYCASVDNMIEKSRMAKL